MYNSESSTYTNPVVSSEALLACLGDRCDRVALSTTPELRLLTIKTCNAPDLLQRCLGSFVPSKPEHMDIVVIDDSKNDSLRALNETHARANDAIYFPVGGERAIIPALVEFIDKTEPNDARHELVSYLGKICTSYYGSGYEKEWGGVAGAQNIAHLCNVMLFGSADIAPDKWLSSFIDDDILLPTNGADVFRMQEIYHNLGSVSAIASNYLHHSSNPIRLTRAAVEYLAQNGDSMTNAEIRDAIANILYRTPTHGFRESSESDCLYTIPELTLAFPMGNYSLSGGKAFNIPVPPVGMEDLGYCDLLQLFEGAKQLGVARVPDFIHKRQRRKNGGDATGALATLYRNPIKEIDHNYFHAVARDYAERDEVVSQENIDGLDARLQDRKSGMSKEISYLLGMLDDLATVHHFEDHHTVLRGLRDNIAASVGVFDGTRESSLDLSFARRLIASMRTLQPRLVEVAYRFGVEGELEKYLTDKKEKMSASHQKLDDYL